MYTSTSTVSQSLLDSAALGIIILVIFVTVIILFAIVVVRIYIQKIKNYTRVIYEKDLEFQKTLTTTIIETQEQVLNNISQDLHDDAGQQLTYINFMIENLKLDKPDLTDDLEPLANSVHILSHSIRRISHSLNSQMLVQQNLIRAIEGEAQRLRQVSGMAIKYEAAGDYRNNFNPGQQIVIFRIFQEIINNALKHSQATEIAIAIAAEPKFRLRVADNGNGFEYDAAKTGLGLINLVNRAEMIGLGLTIDSGQGKGTAITLHEI
ncbi:ATP-binding protein [uncultured Flavobacterium sp.]|uniref:sensor histidine kinase n=1 Tax=uncultured Flavobacterium sp. TaxID=165435 RepID=UPI0025E3802A|nr:ATP-binding protein [uncultured Flavobacterium sp.]